MHIVTLAARIEAVWLARFTFGLQQQHTGGVHEQASHAAAQPAPAPPSPVECSYQNLSRVEVAPGFPASRDLLPAGVICKGINAAIEELRQVPGATLADLIAKTTAGSGNFPPSCWCGTWTSCAPCSRSNPPCLLRSWRRAQVVH